MTAVGRWGIVAVGAVAAMVLAGCTAPENGDSGNDAAGQGGEPVEITFSSWLRGSQAVVDAFNESHDDIQVKFAEVAGAADNYPQLVNQVKAGNAPDVITVEYPRVAEMASQGVLLDISEQAGDLVAEEFPESVQSLVNFGGATWSVPFDAGVLELFYRADLFEQHDLEVPTTWEEYQAVGEQIQAIDPNLHIGPSIIGDPTAYAALAWQNGAQWASIDGEAWGVEIDSAETREAMEIHQEMFDAGVTVAVDSAVQQQQQAAGQLLTVISGSWYGGVLQSGFADQAGAWRVAPLPSPTSEAVTGMYGGSTFGVSANSEKVDAAIEFITWMTTSAEGVEARLSEGLSSTLPTNPTALEAASKSFDTAFYGDQDIYEVAQEGLKTIPEGWVWGPAISTTFSSLTDDSAKVKDKTAVLPDIFEAAQEATVSDMEARGLELAN